MSKYAWIIDKSSIEKLGQDCEEEIIGPCAAPEDLLADLKAGRGEPFKIYDDDGEHYYSGRIVGDYDGFEPLDDFAQPNAGATEIRYKTRQGRWKAL